MAKRKKFLKVVLGAGIAAVLVFVVIFGTIKVTKYINHRKAVSAAVVLLEEGKIAHAEAEFKRLGVYDKFEEDITLAKKEEGNRLITEGHTAFEKGDYVNCVEKFERAGNLITLGQNELARAEAAKYMINRDKTGVIFNYANESGSIFRVTPGNRPDEYKWHTAWGSVVYRVVNENRLEEYSGGRCIGYLSKESDYEIIPYYYRYNWWTGEEFTVPEASVLSGSIGFNMFEATITDWLIMKQVRNKTSKIPSKI